MDVVDAIENVPKGSGDKPKEPVTIVDSGELPIPDLGSDADGKQIPFRGAGSAELCTLGLALPTALSLILF